MTYSYVPKPHSAYIDTIDAMKNLNAMMFDLGIPAFRQLLSSVPRSPTPGLPQTSTKQRDIPVVDHHIRLFTVRPPGTENKILPGLIFIHGGGFCLGDFASYEKFIKDLCKRTKMAILFFEYSLAPEIQFPTATEECFEATLWIHEHASDLNVDANKLVLSGDSSGANLATVTSIFLKDRGFPDIIKGQILLYPAVTSASDLPNYESTRLFGDGKFILSEKYMQFSDENYLPDESFSDDYRFAPIMATSKQLQGLPRALVISAECDVLRDSGEHYAQRLSEAGVDTSSVRVNSVMHGYCSLPIETSAYRQTLDLFSTFVDNCLTEK
ncbi:hypothetical protein DM01DRAFT_1340471 [Hesseltinella vesiculosa]|uniref:Alpha/beta hydrolase fold-3 domain-containing protein n=1 Tax=Hesseltinella vesiculosa TaxID=101127 RepID=A0A1X2G441_9FUNG|nr:hypothetical protein DM01DRAFT_1340471 [Hesseltinella vesiculosa]